MITLVVLIIISIIILLLPNYEGFGEKQANYIYQVTNCGNCKCYKNQEKCCVRDPIGPHYSCKCVSKVVPTYHYFNSPWRPINQDFSIFGNLPIIGTYIENPFNAKNTDYLKR